ncbi:right-handed parallel beta-helix repeat-containing protein [Horticoccus sp. 23ND18S-11]|uniref:right-handed parallel beta-helix repeat-containing protein n=1 Tax=Horticoccus sp. 23ND18S-11 TaxID=3391832 RepID=UPI0039C95E44
MNPRSRLSWAAVLAFALLPFQPTTAAEFYVHPDGHDAHPGTLAQPFASVTRAQEAAGPGDTVWLRGGSYVFSGTTIEIGVLLTKSGAEGKRINYWAYPNETPVFDFHQLATPVRIRGFSVKASWLHLRGLEVRGVQQILTNTNESWGIRVEGGSHNSFERLNLHHHEGPGFFIADGGDNLVLNCDSHHNYDPDKRGENADGFGGHARQDGNVFRGCRAWSNSDDGFDLIHARGVHRIEHCWAWSNGFVPDTDQRAGNGGGFKMGGWLLNPARFPGHIAVHVIHHSLAFNNRAEGFNANYHPGLLRFYNNTAFNNPTQFNLKVAPRLTKPVTHVLRNNVALGAAPPLSGHERNPPDDQFNSWNLETVTVTAEDFMSTEPKGVDGPRQPDGGLPELPFMRPKLGSRLLDAGIAVELPFKGPAPDLGAFEVK